MTDSRWGLALAALRAQREAVRSAAERVEECWAVTGTEATGPDRARRTTAVALSYACEADLVRSAAALLRAHFAGRSPSRRPSAAAVWPRSLRAVWKEQALNQRGGMWRAIRRLDLREKVRAAAGDDPLLAEVGTQLEGLHASRYGHRNRGKLYEKYVPAPDAVVFEGESSPVLLGLPRGHWINLSFASGTGVRIQLDRMAEVRQMERDERAVGERALAFGDAVLELLEHHHGPAAEEAPRLRGAARWIGREDELLPYRPPWPRKPRPEQTITMVGLSLLGFALAAIPWTVAYKSRFLFDHPKLAVLSWVVAAMLAAAAVYRVGFRALQLPGRAAAAPGVAAAIAAVIVWQVQGPVVEHFYPGDAYARYQRQYTDGCLAAGPYRIDAVQSHVEDEVLVVRPISGDPTLRLGPAREAGTDPLRPLDRTTRTVLEEYGC
ncbi:hypothetical protein OOK44_35885 [Streptomyces cellulosae]|uniref:Uncharacterized protein n=1 Tax=Streptomyces althioticus TaxID=83380 RepID=A0ABZ1YJ80_9ACTN|nr:hypothetical protein [Streptomyces cellulosae]WTB86574.1 hypothetical protein OG837_35450 [Streptomyces cellulosae]WTB93383.1 hypothetical protein OIE99_34635 [Streptomyces cellulosae]WTC60775.1 hypothetical protein OH715_36390 [Streptomyces cellulosae]